MSFRADGRPDDATPVATEWLRIAAVPNAGTRIRPHPNGEKAATAECPTASAGRASVNFNLMAHEKVATTLPLFKFNSCTRSGKPCSQDVTCWRRQPLVDW
jgi:hypothetical protein